MFTLITGGFGWSWTNDAKLFRLALYRLSYEPIAPEGARKKERKISLTDVLDAAVSSALTTSTL